SSARPNMNEYLYGFKYFMMALDLWTDSFEILAFGFLISSRLSICCCKGNTVKTHQLREMLERVWRDEEKG
ncbi:MAG: hypothetical protein O3B83_04755, partial [Bacteroidetes bacterium]|nr:hypothetical protein [Bacteroidota bacterium]